MTKLFYVTFTDLDGNDGGLIVEATDGADAVNQWRSWWTALGYYDPQEDEPPVPDQVFELPEKTGSSRYFGWYEEGGVVECDWQKAPGIGSAA